MGLDYIETQTHNWYYFPKTNELCICNNLVFECYSANSSSQLYFHPHHTIDVIPDNVRKKKESATTTSSVYTALP